jgi:bis(5'-nucleosyl)-tetraphosphatase (symmetrical)
MNRYLIGDLQGCLEPLERLLAALPLEPDDQLWFAGDLVNRGPDSLGALRRVRGLGARARTVLGNHDLHLLCVAAGFERQRRGDTLAAVLAAPDAPELLDWLRCQPLAHLEDNFLLVHAGVLPAWSAPQTRALAAEVEACLGGAGYRDFLRKMYGNEPVAWDPGLRGMDRLRLITNVLTRLRLITPGGVIDFSHKGQPEKAPPGLIPWFDAANRATRDHCVLFGHWSALGLILRPDLIGADTGCLWGRHLTAVRLEDRVVFSVSCSPASSQS